MNDSQTVPDVAITVLFPNERAVLLDEVASAIRRNTGKTISRSALIRAMTQVLTPFYREWLHCRSEGDIERMLRGRLLPPGTRAVPVQTERNTV
jgi:hypothetical protein